jgi:DNA-binding transcriptional MerR regulator
MAHRQQVQAAPTLAPEAKLRYRSGAVARMVQMPVATLRIWERRYQAVAPAMSATGHRLYSAADVERVAVLRQLTECGHAIGSIAVLTLAQLREVARTHAATATNNPASSSATAPAAPRRSDMVVVGAALALRLQRPAVRLGLRHPPQIVAVFDTLADATRALPAQAVDRLLWHAPSLRAGDVADLQTAQAVWGAPSVSVFYGFSGAVARQAFVDTGAQLVPEPRDDAALALWLAGLEGLTELRAATPRRAAAPADALWLAVGEVAPRRFDDATLTDLAGLSSTMACECPRHLAELLMQLSNFEAYSADCENLSPVDAELHAYLHRVAGTARGLFESALERVAIHEKLLLP